MNHLKRTIQWHFAPSQCCATITSIGFQSVFSTPKETRTHCPACVVQRLQVCCLPAVDHQWACVGRAFGFDLPDESQQPCGMVRDPVVRPASEVELSDLSDFMNAPLPLSVGTSRKRTKENTWWATRRVPSTLRGWVSLVLGNYDLLWRRSYLDFTRTLKASGTKGEVMFGENANCRCRFQQMDGSLIPWNSFLKSTMLTVCVI